MAAGDAGYGVTAPPPAARTAENAYQNAASAYASEKPPTEQSVGYKSPWWRKLAGIAAGAFAGGVANYYAPRGERVSPDVAGNIAAEIANPRLAAAERQYAQTRQQQGQALPALERGAQIEEQQNAADQRGWQAQTEQAYRQQNADNLAEYRQQGLAQREAADAQRQQYENELTALRAQGGPHRVLHQAADGTLYSVDLDTGAATPITAAGRPVRGALPRAASARQPGINQRYTQQAIANALGSAGGRAGAEQYLRQYCDQIAAGDGSVAAIQAAIDRQYPKAKADAPLAGLLSGAGSGTLKKYSWQH